HELGRHHRPVHHALGGEHAAVAGDHRKEQEDQDGAADAAELGADQRAPERRDGLDALVLQRVWNDVRHECILLPRKIGPRKTGARTAARPRPRKPSDQRYWPARDSTSAILSFVTKPGPVKMELAGATP